MPYFVAPTLLFLMQSSCALKEEKQISTKIFDSIYEEVY